MDLYFCFESEYSICTIEITIILWIISSKIYRRKQFLFKENKIEYFLKIK